MIIDKSSPEPVDLKTRLYHVVADNKISSLDMICSLIGADEVQARSLIEELVDEGTLEGSFTSDGQRFFLSDVRVSTAPVAPTKDEGYVLEKVNTKQAKLVFLAGLVLIISGFIVRGFTNVYETMENVGASILMIGFVVLIAGWLMISRADPPSNLK